LKITNIIERLTKFNYRLSSWFEFVAILAFLGMMAGTLVDVIGSKAFHRPLAAGLEIVFFAQLIAIASALAFSEIDGRQIRVDLFVDLFPKTVRAAFHALAALLGLGLFVILTWKTYQYGMSLKAINDVTATARIPLYPFALWLAICFAVLCLVLIGELLKAVLEGFKK
jgi:TRAP-type C4-dicarboxylate transport system permease small subunit